MEIDAKKSKLHLTFQQWMFKVFINYVLHFITLKIQILNLTLNNAII